jgi:hypothetical protein
VVLRKHEIADSPQQRTLGQPLLGDTEASGDQTEKIVSGELASHDFCCDEAVLIDCRQQILDEDRLPRPDLSSNDDESFGMMQPVKQKGHRSPVHSAFKKEPRIRDKLERRGRKPVKFCVHRLVTAR